MTTPRITASALSVLDASVLSFFDDQRFVLLDRMLSEEELIAARFAYERLWERYPVPEAEKPITVPGCRSLYLDALQEEPDLLALSRNENVLAVAQRLLTSDAVRLKSGHVFKQRLQRRWDYADLGWNHWHHDVDASAALQPAGEITIWLYLDEVTAAEGATQVLFDSVPRQRELLRTGRDPENLTQHAERHLTDLCHGISTAGPAGGGFAWSGSLVHRMTPNRSGIPRRLVTFEFAPVHDSVSSGSPVGEPVRTGETHAD